MLNEVISSEQDLDQQESTDTQTILAEMYYQTIRELEEGQIVTGTVVGITGKEVIVDVGYKAEGVIPITEFSDPEAIVEGAQISVFLESKENDDGMVVISKKKADKVQGWERVIASNGEGDNIEGVVTKKVKGGLVVDIGVDAFLPASLVGIKGYSDLGQYVGQPMTVKIIKVNTARKNIVISRKDFLLEERQKSREVLLKELEVGQIRTGTVKNITDFGAFIDLGGVDGLLHITDMSWGRISHPSEMLAIGNEVNVKILDFDRDNMRVSLGLKQTTDNPWEGIGDKYPVGTKVKGRVVNIVPYGAFVELEKGIEGLVHISELSWTRRITNPSEVLAVGDIVEIVVLSLDAAAQKISLGVKQTEANPWLEIETRCPVGSCITGKVRNLTDYGAFIEIADGIDGLLHISDISRTKKINHPSDVLKKGDEVEAMVLSVDGANQRISLGLKQLEPDPWENSEDRYHVGMIIKGTIVNLTNFGAFVELEEGVDGLLHLSEAGHDSAEALQSQFKEGDEVEVKIIKIDAADRKIGLSLKDVPGADEVSETDVSVEAPAQADTEAADLEQTADSDSDIETAT